MKILIAVAFLGFASCGRLDTAYLPPHQIGFSAAHAGAGAYSGASSYSGFGPQIPILRLDQNNDGDGTYRYNYETGNGISAQEQGDARGDGTKAHGGFSYTSPDGQQVHITYTADENGFQPQGSHIPTPPPIPEAILKSIQQNLADEARGVVDDGSYRDHQYGGGAYRVPSPGSFGVTAHGGGQGHGGYKY